MRNPVVQLGVDVMNAVNALRLKPSARLVGTPDGVEIQQPGKPVLLLTHSAAADFAHQIEESANAG